MYPAKFTSSQNEKIRSYLNFVPGIDRHKRVTRRMALERGFDSVKDLKNHVWGVLKGYDYDLYLRALQRGEFDASPEQMRAQAVRDQRRMAAAREGELYMRSRPEMNIRGLAGRALTGGRIRRRVQATAKVLLKVRRFRKDGSLSEWQPEPQAYRKVILGQRSALQRLAQQWAKELVDLEQYTASGEVGDVAVDSVEVVDGMVHRPGQEQSLEDVPMRHFEALNIVGVHAGVPREYYDRKQGTCVYDALSYFYTGANARGFKKYFKDPNRFHADIAAAYHVRTKGRNPRYDAKTDGVCTADLLEGFCKKFDVPLYLLDCNGFCVKHWQPSRLDPHENKKRPALCYRLMNNHLYPEPSRVNSLRVVMSEYTSKSLLPPPLKHSDAQEKGDDSTTRFKRGSGDWSVVADEPGIQHMRRTVEETGCIPDGSKISACVIGGKFTVTSYCTEDKTFVFAHQVDAVRAAYARMGIPDDQEEKPTIPGLMWKCVEAVKGAAGLARGKPCPDARAVLSSKSATNDGTTGIKAMAQVGLIHSLENPLGTHTAFDISACHAAVMYAPPEPWGLCGPHDQVHHLRSSRRFRPAQAGLYHAVSPDLTALMKKGSAWYPRALLQLAYDEGHDFTIDAFLPTSIELSTDYFQPLLEKFVEVADGDKDLYKALYAHLSGYMGKDTMSRCHCYVDGPSLDTYYPLFNKHVLGDGMEPGPLVDIGAGHCMFSFGAVTPLTELNTTIYLQILAGQSMRVYEMEKQVGGIPMARKSDCVVFEDAERARPSSPSSPVRPSARCSDMVAGVIRTWGRYRPSGIPKLECRIAEARVPLPPPMPGWNDFPAICDSSQVDQLVDVVESKGGALLGGLPGTGKTYMLLKAVEVFRGRGRKVLVTAFTNGAAQNVGGETIDKALGLKQKEDGSSERVHYGRKHLVGLARKVDIMVVDEISLVPMHYLRALDGLKQLNPNIKFILCGDKHQCAPVEVGMSRAEQRKWPHYFDHSITKYLTSNNRVTLTVRHRSLCARLDQALDDIKDGKQMDLSQLPVGFHDRSMSYRRVVRDRVNAIKNREHAPEGAVVLPEWTNDQGEAQPGMLLYPGCRVQAHRTLKRAPWAPKKAAAPAHFIKNESLRVVQIEDGVVLLQGTRRAWNEAGTDFEVKPHRPSLPLERFQQFCRLGYCTTVHTAQGETITEPFTIFESRAMDKQLLYTAVSRARTLAQVHLPPTEVEADLGRDDTWDDELRVIGRKLTNYRRQDANRARVHPLDAYTRAEDVLLSLRRSDYKCEHCRCAMRVLHTPGDPKQWTLQRHDNSLGHVRGNLGHWCLDCNRAAS